MLSSDKKLPLDTCMEYVWTTGKRFWKSIFLHSIHPEIIFEEFITLRDQVPQDRFQCILGREMLAQEVKT